MILKVSSNNIFCDSVWFSLPWALGHDFLSLSLVSITFCPALMFCGTLPPMHLVSCCCFRSSSSLPMEASYGAAFLCTKWKTLTQHREYERCSKDTTSPQHWPGHSRVEYKLTYWINKIGTWFTSYIPSKNRPSTEMRFIVHHITSTSPETCPSSHCNFYKEPTLLGFSPQ